MLEGFNDYLLMIADTLLQTQETAELELWAKGTDFDLALLKNAYQRLGIQPAFAYNVGRDVRTVIALAKLIGWEEVKVEATIAHDALADSEAQAKQVQLAVDYLLKTQPTTKKGKS